MTNIGTDLRVCWNSNPLRLINVIFRYLIIDKSKISAAFRAVNFDFIWLIWLANRKAYVIPPLFPSQTTWKCRLATIRLAFAGQKLANVEDFQQKASSGKPSRQRLLSHYLPLPHAHKQIHTCRRTVRPKLDRSS